MMSGDLGRYMIASPIKEWVPYAAQENDGVCFNSPAYRTFTAFILTVVKRLYKSNRGMSAL